MQDGSVLDTACVAALLACLDERERRAAVDGLALLARAARELVSGNGRRRSAS
jgi:hypothetical protein